jgi:hypothetical protein
MSFYGNLATTAGRLLASYGKALTFTRTEAGAYDPATGTAAETATTYTLNAVVQTFKTMEIDGQRILATDRRVLTDVGTTTPAVGDTVEIEGKAGRVQEVMPLSPAGTPLTYALLVRI